MRVKFIAASAGAVAGVALIALGAVTPDPSTAMGAGPGPMNVGGTSTAARPTTAMPSKAVPTVKAPHR